MRRACCSSTSRYRQTLQVRQGHQLAWIRQPYLIKILLSRLAPSFGSCPREDSIIMTSAAQELASMYMEALNLDGVCVSTSIGESYSAPC